MPSYDKNFHENSTLTGKSEDSYSIRVDFGSRWGVVTFQEKNPQDCLPLSQIPPPLEYPEFGHSFRELASLSDFSTRWAGAVLEYALSAPDKYKHL